MRSEQTGYLERLDHLRLLAALLVVGFHAFHRLVGDLRPDNPLLSLLDEGHTGIGLFMVISGFIFTVIADGHRIDYLGFLRNRLVRIYPLYVVAVFFTLSIGTWNQHLNHGSLTYLEWLLPFRAASVSQNPHFVQLWTIWVECQFYLMFPFLKAFADRHGARYLWGWIGLLVALRAGVFVIEGSVRFIAYESIFGRLDQFLLGMLAARAYLSRPRLAAAWWSLPVATLAVLTALHWFNRQGGHTRMDAAWWIGWTTLEGLVWAGFAIAWLRCPWRPPGALERALAAMGAMSFSIYVMHNFVLSVLHKAGGVLPLAVDPIRNAALNALLIACPLAILAAWPTWRLIERPFLSLRGRYLLPAPDSPVPGHR